RALENVSAGERIVYRFAFPANIGKGNYSIALSLSRFDSHLDTNYEWRDFALVFHMININKPDFVGCNALDADLSIERLRQAASV
ncbi:MAG: Wzt carbohydrate-binding domain-containing protein, partial [Burkholderiaceae bacterium]|nr:Wzt carbohydrate-binding domain-containing protein [Burkholderiaceae bacterium]